MYLLAKLIVVLHFLSAYSQPIQCETCEEMKHRIDDLQELNMRLLKEVFVYRHVFGLQDKDVEQLSNVIENENEINK